MTAVHSFEDRFWSRLAVKAEGDCWEWIGSRDSAGYGLVRLAGRLFKSHRMAYMLIHGDFYGCVMHSCDNPPCCNPTHLSVGTAADNARDRDMKGRHKPFIGSAHPRAVLNEAAVLRLRADRAKGLTYNALAKAYGIHPATVANICQRDSWRHVK